MMKRSWVSARLRAPYDNSLDAALGRSGSVARIADFEKRTECHWTDWDHPVDRPLDFALDTERKHGKSSSDAIYEACLLRFRPIMMTTMAELLGGLPLALGTGTGSEMRRPLGITIVGLIVSQMLTLFTTPVVYIYIDRLRLWLRQLRSHDAPMVSRPAQS